MQSDTGTAKWDELLIGYSRVPVPGESLVLPATYGGGPKLVLAVTHLPFDGSDTAARVTLKHN